MVRKDNIRKDKDMRKTKKTAAFVLLTILLACFLAGCTKPAEVESTEDSTVQVKVVDEYYRGPYMTSMHNFKSFRYTPCLTVYHIAVEYNGKQYYLTDKESYELYHDKIGETADALLRTTKWDNGNVTYDIIGLAK